MKIVIADASCLITLENINDTDLLRKLYEQIVVTPEVAAEVGVTSRVGRSAVKLKPRPYSPTFLQP